MPLNTEKPTSYVPLKPRSPEEMVSNPAKGFGAEGSQLEREGLFIPETPKRSIADLVVPAEVRSRIDAVINRVKNHKKLYEEWGLEKIDPFGKRVAINLYGAPGTGKTFCAEAIAHYMGKNIIRINYAEIESKYVGDTPKNITAAFKKARTTDSVLFFDEADSILGRRLTSVTQSADHGVNVSRSVMLLQLDQFDGIVLFATNLASNYDAAFVRRIMAHIEFQLPDYYSRVKLWQMHLPEMLPLGVDVKPAILAEQSDGLSGGDIKNVVINAASVAVARSGIDQKISMSDLLSEISHSKTAKNHVGAQDNTVRIVESEQLIMDAPNDVQEKFKQVKAGAELTPQVSQASII